MNKRLKCVLIVWHGIIMGRLKSIKERAHTYDLKMVNKYMTKHYKKVQKLVYDTAANCGRIHDYSRKGNTNILLRFNALYSIILKSEHENIMPNIIRIATAMPEPPIMAA